MLFVINVTAKLIVLLTIFKLTHMFLSYTQLLCWNQHVQYELSDSLLNCCNKKLQLAQKLLYVDAENF